MGLSRKRLRAARISGVFLVAVAATTAQAAQVVVVNKNAAGVGFNDPTAATPVGGNTGTTIGAQRLIAFQAAADIWAGHIASTVPIRVGAQFTALSCNQTSAVLGSAGPNQVFRNFTGAPVANTWYVGALANSLAKTDLDNTVDDINANFNANIGTSGCLQSLGWYYGLDSNPPAGTLDFVTVLVHEMGHGLGFLSLVDLASGAKFNSADDAYMRFLENHGASPADYPSMTNAQRVAASINTTNLHFVGPNVKAGNVLLTAGKVGDHVQMFAPNPAQSGSSVSHWDTAATPNQIMEPSYTVPLHSPTLERALFRDIGWQLVKPRNDFTGDAKTDILWRNTSGDTVISAMNGTSIASSTFVVNLPSNWVVAGTGDFNGDGKSDILWRNTSTGDVVISLVNGNTITSSTFVANLPLSWSVAGVGDFNGDGKADILWRNSNGDTVVSFVSDTAIVSSVFMVSLPTTWSVAGIGDFNGDGKADILWRNSNGDAVVSFVSGASITSSTFIANLPMSWTVAGVADFDGDGQRDILWRNSNGDTVVSLMNGASIASSTFIGNIPSNWTVAQVGDVNSDGKADILWRSASGDTTLSIMNGPVITSSVAVGNVPTTWTVQGGKSE